MQPYKNIQSHNLTLLLLLARVTAYLGIAALCFSVFILAFVALTSGFMTTIASLVFLPISLGVLLISGVMAAIVAVEENYRIRTLHLVGIDKL